MAKTYRRKWLHYGCIIRQRGEFFQVEIHYNGKRERHSEPIPADAKTYAE